MTTAMPSWRVLLPKTASADQACHDSDASANTRQQVDTSQKTRTPAPQHAPNKQLPPTPTNCNCPVSTALLHSPAWRSNCNRALPTRQLLLCQLWLTQLLRICCAPDTAAAATTGFLRALMGSSASSKSSSAAIRSATMALMSRESTAVPRTYESSSAASSALSSICRQDDANQAATEAAAHSTTHRTGRVSNCHPLCLLL